MRTNLFTVGQILSAIFVFFALEANAESLHFYINPHASGDDCQTALNNLTGYQLYHGQGANGVPTIGDTTLMYTVESLDEANQLCAQIGSTPSPLLTSDQASAYQPSAHPWISQSAPSSWTQDNRCAIVPNSTQSYVYLQLTATCL